MITVLEIYIGVIVVFALFLIKNNITCMHHFTILDAVLEYRIECVENNTKMAVDYNDLENYDKTLFRIWDWGYTRILPKDKFEIIKPYIKTKKEA